MIGRTMAALLALAGSALAQAADEVPYLPNAVPAMTNEGAQFGMRLSDARRAPEWFIAIYSGTTLGTYFYVASGICRVLEATFAEHRIHCVSLRSSGVGGNVRLMNAGQAQAIMVQSDTNFRASAGDAPMPRARSGLSLHNETGVMVVGADSGIETIGDLRGKRVNLGSEGSATRGLWLDVLEANGLAPQTLGRVYSATQDSNVRALCDGSIDAFATWIGHPSTLVASAISRCDARVVGMWTEGTAAMIEDETYLFEQTIPAGTYGPGSPEIRSYGFKASLLFHEEVPSYVTCHIARALFENPDLIRAQHPSLAALDLDQMLEQGHFLPRHPGVEQYRTQRRCPPVPTESGRLPARLTPQMPFGTWSPVPAPVPAPGPADGTADAAPPG